MVSASFAAEVWEVARPTARIARTDLAGVVPEVLA